MSPDGFYRFGETEWEGLEGAAQYALDKGAEDLILVGYSMGGAIITNFLFESLLAEQCGEPSSMRRSSASKRSLITVPLSGVFPVLSRRSVNLSPASGSIFTGTTEIRSSVSTT